ncbi:metallophosphoesterase [Natranaerobius trueperi]|uniref:Serine/threonine protein phosphatase n=1 Tax=Natranaerobius trueperi TaxID=759412 RepID=A0A226BYX0_9FIRM|nr:metallophosphoesterase [Natranaerobius trueperi]OWZ83524.1 serine/threonine protein phosphatase [Natranaerobius trueperi]
MHLFAISDLHLSLQADKPMDVFGPLWENYHERIKENWEEVVTEDDTVIIGGDFSWALKLEEVKKDACFIHELPGKKVLFKGNHDYWWNSYKKVKETLPESFFVVQNNYYPFNDKIAICGTRGWQTPCEERDHDKKVYNREINRLKLSLDAAIKDGYQDFIVTLHYPPFARDNDKTSFTEVLKEYGVKVCIYGHLHGEDHKNAFIGEKEGIVYYFVSSDYLGFKPIPIKV